MHYMRFENCRFRNTSDASAAGSGAAGQDNPAGPVQGGPVPPGGDQVWPVPPPPSGDGQSATVVVSYTYAPPSAPLRRGLQRYTAPAGQFFGSLEVNLFNHQGQYFVMAGGADGEG